VLLTSAGDFIDPIFVSGCQRSGTTLLTRLIKESPEINDIQYTKDDELDAGYILAGYKSVGVAGRCCFQTTYLNECYGEYLGLNNAFKLIWVIRNPFSVIYSMAYNWSRFSLNELFLACGYREACAAGYKGGPLYLLARLSAVDKACFSYRGKLNQLFELSEQLNECRLLVIDYDELIRYRGQVLRSIFGFVNVEYDEKYASRIDAAPSRKAEKLSQAEKEKVRHVCADLYAKAKGKVKPHA